ncbi:MAG: hypothetical protein U9O85_06245 [Euryarchaeota archaeon]|nr:hypothetical protein [Euryarchaeota archaeon]
MREYKTVFFEPEIRVKMLAELVYPVIFRSAWQTEDKIRALFRHKLRVDKSITELRDATDREDLCATLNALYTYYIALLGVSSADVENCESAVKEEFKRIEIEVKAVILSKSKFAEDVSTSVKWMEARVGMLRAHTMKKSYMHQSFTEDELATFVRDLDSIETKLSEEPHSQVKRDLYVEIERIRELLLSL